MHAGDRRHRALQLIVEIQPLVGCRVGFGCQVDIGGQEMRRLKTERSGDETMQALDHQSRTGKKYQRKRHLTDDEIFSNEMGSSAFLLKDSIQIETRRFPRGRKAE